MQKLFFDIETTGSDATKDRIVELAIRIVDEEGNVVVNKAKRYNPGIPIQKSATEVHGISSADVEHCPSFKEDAKKLKKMFEDKIIITYNGLRFDIPILMSEFERAGVDVELSGSFIDVLKVERKLAPHTLSATYKKYTGQDLEDAHEALSDVTATETVMSHQIANFNLSEDDLIEMTDTSGMADYYGKLRYDDKGFLVFNFGKNKNLRVVDEKNYAAWMLDTNFPSQVKKLIREEQTKGLKPRKSADPAPKSQKPGKSTPAIQGGYKPLELGLGDDLPF
jgi:DNA polymerase-3 subunit epsilon